jgi:selenium metabolism protein YedF
MADKKLLLLITSSGVGEGEVDLGGKLMASFLKMIAEADRRPDRIVFINAGVFLTTADSPLQDTLTQIEKQGTEILSCGTCLDYYGRKEKLVIGSPTNMKDIVSDMIEFKKVITV